MKAAISLLAVATVLGLSACNSTAGNNTAAANTAAPAANAVGPAPVDANLTAGNTAAGNSTKPAGDGNEMLEDEGMIEDGGNMIEGR